MEELACHKCKCNILKKGQVFLHEKEGILCSSCLHSLPWDEQKEDKVIVQYDKHFRSGWMKVHYFRRDINDKPGWMLPVPRDLKVFIPLEEDINDNR